MRSRLSTKTRQFDLDRASVYLAARLARLDDDETCRFAEVVGRAKSTVQAWAAGRCVPPRNVWPRIGQFFGEGPSAMFDAASRKLNPPPKHFPHQHRESAGDRSIRETVEKTADTEASTGGEDDSGILHELAALRARVARLEQTAPDPQV